MKELENGIIEKLEELKASPSNPGGVLKTVDSFQGDIDAAVEKMLMRDAGALVLYTGGILAAVNIRAGRYLHDAGFVIVLGVDVTGGRRKANDRSKDTMLAVMSKLSGARFGLVCEPLEFTSADVGAVKNNKTIITLSCLVRCLIETG